MHVNNIEKKAAMMIISLHQLNRDDKPLYEKENTRCVLIISTHFFFR